ncbi:MAG TPA: hypothetical protein VK453_25355 [Micromonosporaceae bacterium]|nr:hypothetical protein [Micromonosporaceae bacterium]
MANPQHFTLVADTEKVFTLDQNYGQVRITVLANPAIIYFNAADAAIGPVAGSMDGNEALPAVLCSRVVADRTSGTVSKVRVRSAGTPTISVSGL